MIHTLARFEKKFNEEEIVTEIFISVKLHATEDISVWVWEQGYWLTDAEKDAVVADEQALLPIIETVAAAGEVAYSKYHPKPIIAKNIKVLKYNTVNQVEKETWYNKDNGDGTYSDIVEETTYTYNSSSLLYTTVKTYYDDGTLASSIRYEYYRNANNEIIEKRIEE